MLVKSVVIERLLKEHPELRERRFGLPNIGHRTDGKILTQLFKISLMRLILWFCSGR